ncbi:YwqG family protein [Saccharomonospora iraqiensis]|uniref:YwqG family protein n=1 Tax=Saccharomonospora iraqiensis TaxID=52698 RepID=UPI00041DE531|nr:YwqG family protein [Saccharomonospora iraqiensis]
MWTLDHQRTRLRDLLGDVFDTVTADRLLALTRTGLRLVPGRSGDAGHSRLGGLPRLDDGTPWPTCRDVPLDPLAVIDLADLGPCDLPVTPSGVRFLSVFLVDQPELLWTTPDSSATWRVLPAGADAVERSAPDNVRVRSARTVEFAPVLTLPAWEDEIVPRTLDVADTPHPADREDRIDVYTEVTEVWDELIGTELGHHDHRIGGWPTPVQAPVFGDVETDSAPDHSSNGDDGVPWRLLLQLDSDEHLGWEWGDSGMLYFVAHDAHLQAGDFDATWLEMQCT